MRSYDTVQDVLTLQKALNICYEELLGHREVSEEELKGWIPQMALDGVFLLYGLDGEVVGICRAEISEQLSSRRGRRTGYVDSHGIVPARRNGGLYLPLLLFATRWIRAKETVDIELESWGDDLRPLALYQGIGFAITRQDAIHRLDLR